MRSKTAIDGTVMDDPGAYLRHNGVDTPGIAQIDFMDSQTGEPFQTAAAGTGPQKGMDFLPLSGKTPDESPPHKPGCTADKDAHSGQNSLMVVII